MSTRLVHLVVDAAVPSRQAAFWAAALGWEVVADEPDEAVAWPAGFDYPGIAALPLVFVPVRDPKEGKNRVHLDLASASLDDQAAIVRRLRDLGAVPTDIDQREVPWVVLADPEGNEVCVLEPRSVYRGTGPVAAVVIDCADPSKLVGFWTEASGWRVASTTPSFCSLRSASGAGPFLELIRVAGSKNGKNRIHPDVAPPPGGDNQAEAARLRAAGATAADVGQGDVRWVVLADPEGNEFCVLTPR
jgi:catechol 2,3-dioxygenase-like lactoylglutathione lyase family enzyme